MFKQKFTQKNVILFVFVAMFSNISVYATSKSETSTIATEKYLRELIAGNQRFKSGKIRQGGQTAKDIERLAKGQSPKSIVLSCSDSRVPPEAIFDQKLGEMFTIRTAGQTLSAQAIASIEYAIVNLGTKLIVVLGHTNCGAVKAAVETIDGKNAGSENLDQLVKDIHPRIRDKFTKNSVSKNLKTESKLNARGIAEDLIKRSKIIEKAVQSGEAQIKVGLYNLETGIVEFE